MLTVSMLISNVVTWPPCCKRGRAAVQGRNHWLSPTTSVRRGGKPIPRAIRHRSVHVTGGVKQRDPGVQDREGREMIRIPGRRWWTDDLRLSRPGRGSRRYWRPAPEGLEARRLLSFAAPVGYNVGTQADAFVPNAA